MCPEESNADKLMKGALSKISGVPEGNINFVNSRNKKKNNKKKSKKKIDTPKIDDIIIRNEEGFILRAKGYAQQVEFEDMRLPRHTKTRWRKNIADWNSADVFYYIGYLYAEKYGQPLPLNQIPAQVEIKKIQGALEEEFGAFHWLMIKDYVIFFFEKYIDFFRRKNFKNGCFYINHMLNDKVIKAFVKQYNFEKSCREYNLKEKDLKDPIMSLKNSEIEKSFILGDANLVSKFGVVISVNWLMKVKSMTEEEAVRIVKSGCHKIFKRKAFQSVKEATEKFSPYPSWLPFKDYQSLLLSIISDVSLSVNFKDTESNINQFYESMRKRV
jgi:hypothetical protein